MSCLSDIDLATLHQLRLNERVHYKLSWWNRPSVVQQRREREQQQQPKAKVQADHRRMCGNRSVNESAKDIKNQCDEHIKNDPNGMQSRFSNESVHKSVDTLGAEPKKGLDRCNTNRNVKTTASGSCDTNACDSNSRQSMSTKCDSNSTKMCHRSVDESVVNESAISVEDDHLPYLRRRRSGTWP